MMHIQTGKRYGGGGNKFSFSGGGGATKHASYIVLSILANNLAYFSMFEKKIPIKRVYMPL